MSDTDKIMSQMQKLDKKVHSLSEMMSKFDKEMKNIKHKDKSKDHKSIQSLASSSEHSDPESLHEAYNYEFKFLDEKADSQRNSTSKSHKSARKADDIFSFLYPDSRGDAGVIKRESSKSATKERPSKEYDT